MAACSTRLRAGCFELSCRILTLLLLRRSKKKEQKKWEPPLPTRVGKKKKRGPDARVRLPPVYPTTRCRLKLLKQERIKDYLLLEEGTCRLLRWLSF